jgi:pimeloyl-ACP methyl ester carboxylesterase
MTRLLAVRAHDAICRGWSKALADIRSGLPNRSKRMGKNSSVDARSLRNGLRLAIDRYDGDGRPILLLHGIPGSRRTWRQVARRLQHKHEVIVPDLLGFGGSSDPLADFHALGQAEAMWGLLDDLGIRDIHAVGFDFGGPIAVAMYRQRPERVGTLTLAATNVFADTPVPLPLRTARLPGAGEALFSAMCSWPGLAALWIPAVRDKAALPWGAFLESLPNRRGRQSTRRIFLDSIRHLQSRYKPIQETLGSIRCPAAVIWGDGDPFFPVSVGERTAVSIRGATFRLLSGCGHFIPGERPDALAAAILALADPDVQPQTGCVSESGRHR